MQPGRGLGNDAATMRSLTRTMRMAPLALALALAGCGYVPIPPDPIRYVNSPADVMNCRKLGAVGFARTDGFGPVDFTQRTYIVPAFAPPATVSTFPVGEIQGPNFAVRLETMRDAALSLGASDLLLTRRIYRDWSYVSGTAYRCPR